MSDETKPGAWDEFDKRVTAIIAADREARLAEDERLYVERVAAERAHAEVVRAEAATARDAEEARHIARHEAAKREQTAATLLAALIQRAPTPRPEDLEILAVALADALRAALSKTSKP